MSDEPQHSVNEKLIERFELAWQEEQRPELQDFLPPDSDPAYLATLEELVCIDIEFALKAAVASAGSAALSLAVVEDYVSRFAELDDPPILLRLIREEALVRNRLGYEAADAEYERRFPGVVQAAQASDKQSAAPPTVSQQLLFGLLALQNGLISREQLVSAFAKWTSDKSVPLNQLLVADSAVDANASEILRELVKVHVQRHGGDPQHSLMSLSGSDLPAAKAALAKIEDRELYNTIAAMPDLDLAATLPPTVGQVTSAGGRFRILRPLPGAQGGMGVISVARDEELGRQVALKQIIADRADHAAYRQKFQVEAEITGNLEHPGIVPIYGLGVGADGRPYYAMRLVHGDNLSVQINKFHAALAAGEVDYNSVEFHGLIDRLIDVAQAIRYAHSRGVLHRDLKPGNILVGNYGETLVIDWGLARLPQAEEESEAGAPEASLDSQAPLQIRSGTHVDATMQGQILGTVGYAPPEQLNGRIDLITERSDVYALGAILYQILVGKPPVTSEDSNLDELIKDTIAGKITPPRRLRRAAPKSLSAVCLQALEREPEDRYESVEEFVAEIERWKADQPVNAAPDSITDRLMRMARRYRSAALAGATALVGIAAVAGLALVVVNGARLSETQARNEAESLLKEKVRLAEEKTQLADRNQSVVDAFVAAFRSADPENEGVTSNMTALEVLQQALDQIKTDEDLAKDELAKATLLQAIGSSLTSLGAYTQAVSALNEVLRLRRVMLGDEDQQTLRSMDSLAWAYKEAGQQDKALPLFEESFRLHKTKMGDDHLETLGSMHNLVTGYHAAGQLEQLPLFEESLRLHQAKLGDNHPNTLRSMNTLALGYEAAGESEKALQLYEQLLPQFQAELGEDHPNTLRSMSNLANAYRRAGRREEALPLMKEALRLRKLKLGDQHPDTLASTHNLVMAYYDAGRLDKLPLAEESLRLHKATLGDDHPDTLRSMNSLAMAYQAAGRLGEALPLYEESFPLFQARLGETHAHTLRSMNNLVWAYQAAGRFEEALPLSEEAFRISRDKLGEDDSDTLASMHNLVLAYHAAGRLDKLPLFEESLQLHKAKLGDEDPATLRSMNSLALAYQDVGRLEEAIPLFEDSLRLFKIKLGDDHPHTLKSMYNMARAYQQAGRLADALPLYLTTLRVRAAKFVKGHPDTLGSVEAAASVLTQTGRFDEAKPIIEDWINQLDAQQQPEVLARAETMRAACLVELGQVEEAIAAANSALRNSAIADIERLRAESVLAAALVTQGDSAAQEQLVSAYQAMRKRLPEIDFDRRWYVPRACERVIKMYDTAGQPDKVREWKTELAEVNVEIERL